jgi:hypothetical protein
MGQSACASLTRSSLWWKKKHLGDTPSADVVGLESPDREENEIFLVSLAAFHRFEYQLTEYRIRSSRIVID